MLIHVVTLSHGGKTSKIKSKEKNSQKLLFCFLMSKQLLKTCSQILGLMVRNIFVRSTLLLLT